jgi:hypothetical protein
MSQINNEEEWKRLIFEAEKEVELSNKKKIAKEIIEAESKNSISPSLVNKSSDEEYKERKFIKIEEKKSRTQQIQTKKWYQTRIGLLLIMIVGGVLAIVLINNLDKKAIKNEPAPVHQDNSEPSLRTYSSEQIKTANFIMENVRQLANVFEEGDHLVVKFQHYLFPDDINKRLDFVSAVANADCILVGKPRLIFYYNPDGKQIAQADSLNGIRLKD